jgi:hypothetical protein
MINKLLEIFEKGTRFMCRRDPLMTLLIGETVRFERLVFSLSSKMSHKTAFLHQQI